MSELKSTRDAYGEALVEIGEKVPNLVVLDADLSTSTRTGKFGEKFPDRFFNVGIAEANMMGIAAGLAACGKVAVASSFAVFASGRAWDQIRVSVAYAQSNVKVGATHSGLCVGEDGPTHHAISDLALMRSIPGIRVLQPCDDLETKQCIASAITTEGPFYIRLNRMPVQRVHNKNYHFELGKADQLLPGKDIALFATGIGVQKALAAVEPLRREGISAVVINFATLKPLDHTFIIDMAKKVAGIITIWS
jgi:transketolase